MATYCPGRMVEHSKIKSTGGFSCPDLIVKPVYRYLVVTSAHLNPSKVDVLKEERDKLVRQVFQYEGLFSA